MNDEQYRDMVVDHDKHIDKLTSSVEVLAGSVGSTNKKLDDVIEIITQQNILAEKVNHIDTDTREAFVRIDERVRKIEEAREDKGCSALKVAVTTTNSLGRSVDTVKSRVNKLEDHVDGTVSSVVIRWGYAGTVFAMLSLFGFVTTEIHRLDSLTATKIHSQKVVHKEIDEELARIWDMAKDRKHKYDITKVNVLKRLNVVETKMGINNED